MGGVGAPQKKLGTEEGREVKEFEVLSAVCDPP